MRTGGPLRARSLAFIMCFVMQLPFLAKAAPFSTYFDLTLLGDAYVTGQQSELNNAQLQGRFKLSNEFSGFETYLDLGAGGLAGEKAESYLILPQAYIAKTFTESVKLTVGRRVMNWSALDDYWQLGDVQPLFRWDSARPEIQGISGVTLEIKPTDYLQLDLFGSYLYIPSQGPSFSISDGKLTSGNPWFSPPVDILAVSGQPYDLLYSVKTPDLSDIVFQPSYGAVLTLKTPDDAYSVRGGYFVKPRNELALPFEGTINISNNTGDIEVHPQVAEHKISTLDIAYKSTSWGVTLSGLYESDITFDTDPNWIYPQLSDQYKAGLMFNVQATPFHRVEFGGIRTFNNRVTALGLGSNSGSIDVYSFRNQYDNAADVRLLSVFAPRPHGFLFQTRLRYAYDYKVETSLISADVNYNPIADLTLFARMDLFGGSRVVSDSYNNLLVNYLDNDRFQMGVKYVF